MTGARMADAGQYDDSTDPHTDGNRSRVLR